MWYTYIIKSQKNGKYYIGYTGELEDRVRWHNQGKSRWTKRYIPWELVYFEEFSDKSEAIKREKRIKAYKNKDYIEQMIQRSGPVV